ncbi:MAG: helix-turn-helix domain-containing protein [Hungatella hathewayi]|uniref:helix-turn-helix domain-containing protein n=1 Tax=Blautia sp. TaxID=1955243 RepID=UPI00290A16E6|nr:helix-turn-helix domain-containing protein [Hungatella hathewayi]
MGDEELKKYLSDLANRVEKLESHNPEKWVTVKELSEIMSCPENTIYRKIRSGAISATRQTGEIRIPMSQFYKPDGGAEDSGFQIKPQRTRKREKTMEEMVFGR